jgi:hypothetical protein
MRWCSIKTELFKNNSRLMEKYTGIKYVLFSTDLFGTFFTLINI